MKLGELCSYLDRIRLNTVYFVIDGYRLLGKALRVVMVRNLQITLDSFTRVGGFCVQITEHVKRGYIPRIVVNDGPILQDGGADLPMGDITLGVSHCLCSVETHFRNLKESSDSRSLPARRDCICLKRCAQVNQTENLYYQI